MRGRDPDSGDFFSPSRSQRKRDAEAILELAEQLVALSAQQLAKVPLPDALRDVVRETQRITSHIAHKRQLHYLAKQMRREDDDTIDEIRHHLQRDRSDARRETASLHRLEHWRERLLEEGDEALGELAEQYPDIDRHHLRQLVRAAKEERHRNQPPKAFRQIFQELRKAFAAEAADAGNDESE